MNAQEIISAVESMTILELADLVKAMEEKFGVSAAAPVAVAAGPAAAAEAAEEKTEFDVVLKDVGAEKIKVIKVVREITGLGRQELEIIWSAFPKSEVVLRCSQKHTCDPLFEAIGKDALCPYACLCWRTFR